MEETNYLDDRAGEFLDFPFARIVSTISGFLDLGEGILRIGTDEIRFYDANRQASEAIPWQAVTEINVYDVLDRNRLMTHLSALIGGEALIGTGAGIPMIGPSAMPTVHTYPEKRVDLSSTRLFHNPAKHSTVIRVTTFRGSVDFLVRYQSPTVVLQRVKGFVNQNLTHIEIRAILPMSYEAATLPSEAKDSWVNHEEAQAGEESSPGHVRLEYTRVTYKGTFKQFPKPSKGTLLFTSSGVRFCDSHAKTLFNIPWEVVWGCGVNDASISYRSIHSTLIEFFFGANWLAWFIPSLKESPINDVAQNNCLVSIQLRNGKVDFLLEKVWLGKVEAEIRQVVEEHNIHMFR